MACVRTVVEDMGMRETGFLLVDGNYEESETSVTVFLVCTDCSEGRKETIKIIQASNGNDVLEYLRSKWFVTNC